MNYVPNTREVIIDRGAMGFGFTLRRPSPVAASGQGFEPTYLCGATVRSVEEKGPASRGGLDKDEVVAAVNNEVVRGKSYLQVINMIQATSRRLVLKVLTASWPEEMANCSALGENPRGMEDVTAEKENQLHLPRSGDRLSCVSEPSPDASWRQSTPSGSAVDIPVAVAGAADADLAPSAQPTLHYTTAPPPLRPHSSDSPGEHFRALGEFGLEGASGADSNLSEQYPRPTRASTTSSVMVTCTGGSNFTDVKAIGLTRSSGHLYSDAERGPIITVKKAYQPHSATTFAVREAPLSSTGDARLTSSSSAGSAGGASPGQPAGSASTRHVAGEEGRFSHLSSHDRSHRGLPTAAEPRINFKKRKSGANNNNGGATGAGLTGTRAQSVGHLPGGVHDPIPPTSSRIASIVSHYQPPSSSSPLTSAKHRLGASSTHNILTSMPSTSRARVASPPGGLGTEGSGTSVGMTLMYSPMRRGSSPARSITAASVAPLSGTEELDAGSTVSSGYHETRFSMIQDRIVSNVAFTGQRAEASALPNKHSLQPTSALNRTSWQSHLQSHRSQQHRTILDGAASSALLTSHSSSALMQLPSYSVATTSVLSSPASSYLLQQQQHQQSSSVVESSNSSVTFTTSVTSSCRSLNDLRRAQFMGAKPTPPPPLPLPKVGASPPALRCSEASSVSTTTTASSENPCGSVIRRDSYINAVKTNRSTMLSPEAIDEGEEQDDGADSAVEDAASNEVHDPNVHSLQKAKRFFGESSSGSSKAEPVQWARRSGKSKTPKLKEAIAAGGKESLGLLGCGPEKKFYLSVKVIRDDGKEPKSRSWKSFSLAIENDVMYLMRERKESSASSSSSVEDVHSPIPLRQCHFEWTAPDVASRKKYLVCRMIVNPPSPPESTSSLLVGGAPTSSSDAASSAALHGTSPPGAEAVSGAGISEYKLQFPDSEQMQSFYNCLPNSAASVSVIGGPSDFSATYPPGPKAVKKAAAKAAAGGANGQSAKLKKSGPLGGTAELELAAMAGELDFGSSIASHSSKLKSLVKNLRGWKSSSTESTVTTSSSSTVHRTFRFEEYSSRQRSVSPDEVGRPLLGCTFSVPLTQVPRASCSPYVPFVVELCTKIVEACGLHCVGVYRVSPKKAVIDALEAELNECGPRLDLIDRTNERWNDVHAVSGLLKCFLRKMPDPLFPHNLYRDFVNASNRSHPHERKMLLLQRLLALMESDESGHPEYKHHRETLLYLVQHLRRVAAHSNVNRMNSKNLASMIAPNVFRPMDATNPAMIMESTTHGATILELVLNHHEWMFSTDLDSGRAVPPPVTQEVGHNQTSEACGGDHEQEGGSHNEDALGGAEDTGGANRSDLFEYKPGENGRDILSKLLEAAIACQTEVSPEAAAIASPDEGGFDEVDIDAAVRRRQQMDAAAAAAAAAAGGGGTGRGDLTAGTNGSGCKPPAEELLSGCGRLGELPRARCGSASLHEAEPLPPSDAADWHQVAHRAEMALASSANDLRVSPGRREGGGRWFGATVQPRDEEVGAPHRAEPPPPLPPRLYDPEVERRRLGSPDSLGVRHQRQMSKSLDSLTAVPTEPGPAPAATSSQAPAGLDRQVSSPAPQIPPRSAGVAALKRQRAKAADGMGPSHLT